MAYIISLHSRTTGRHKIAQKARNLAATLLFFIGLAFCAVTSPLLLAQTPLLPAMESGSAIVFASSMHDSVAFIPHIGAGDFDNYLAMNLPFAPVQNLREQLERLLGKTGTTPLKHRGEAHITVITPPEYAKVLSKVLSMNDVNRIADSLHIQRAKFDVLCVGRAQIALDGRPEQTYFVVVQSADLLAIRRAVFKRYVERGGEPSLFDPTHFYPHITIGFSKRDLHEEGDNVRKGQQCCIIAVKER
jgi:2'-5' RNA ligase